MDPVCEIIINASQRDGRRVIDTGRGNDRFLNYKRTPE